MPEPKTERADIAPTARLAISATAIVFLAVLFFFAVSAWLDISSFHALAGDDLRSFTYAREGFTAYNDASIQYGRLRPVLAFLTRLSVLVTGGDFDQLRSIIFGIHTLNALLLCALLAKVVEVPWLTAGAIAIAASFTRFTNYLISAELGLLEGAGITLFLLFLWTQLRLLRAPRISTACASALLFALIIHLHERYLVLLGGMVVVSLLLYRQNRRVSGLLFFSGLAIAGGNILVKTMVLHSRVLVGTTGQPIDYALGPKVKFFFDGLVNLIGINRGHSALSVRDYLESPAWLKAISLLSAGFAVWLLCGAVLAAIRTSPGRSARDLLRSIRPQPVVLGTLIAALVLSASVTFRQEYRWLYPGYLAFLVLAADSAKHWNAGRGASMPFLILSGFLLCAIPREVGIRMHREDFYQYLPGQAASALHELISQSPSLKTANVITIGGDELPFNEWVFMEGTFSRYYGFPPLQFRGGPAEADNASNPSLVRYDARQKKFFENSRARAAMLLPSPPAYTSSILANARILGANETNLQTPNGTRRVPFTFSEYGGWAMVAPVEFIVDRPEKAGVLYLSFSHMWKKAGVVHLQVFAVTNGEDAKLLAVTVPPLQRDSVAEWQDSHIALPATCQSIRVQLLTRGDGTATWLMFRQFVLE